MPGKQVKFPDENGATLETQPSLAAQSVYTWPDDHDQAKSDEDTGHGRKRFDSGQSLHGDTVSSFPALAVCVRGGRARSSVCVNTPQAARRRAITELLFFASVGDLRRCQRIVRIWNLQVNDPTCCDYDKRTPL